MKVKKILRLLICFALLVLVFTASSYATIYNYESFTVDGGYGTKEKIDDNITLLKGGDEGDDGMKEGAYSKSSTETLENGIKEETHVKIDLENMKQSELFQVSLALNNEEGKYVNEEVVTVQKNGDVAYVTASGMAGNIATIGETGIYTIRWEVNKREDNGANIKVSILNYDTLIGTTGQMDFDSIEGPDSLKISEQTGTISVRYLWFCNIKVENGISVYASLPPKPTDPALVPSTEPTTPQEQPAAGIENVKDDTPKTGSIDLSLVAAIASIISLMGIVIIRKCSK